MASAAARFSFASAFGLACGAACASEWALEPQVFADADSQSNRTLRAGTPSSQSFAAGLDLDASRLSGPDLFLFIDFNRRIYISSMETRSPCD